MIFRIRLNNIVQNNKKKNVQVAQSLDQSEEFKIVNKEKEQIIISQEGNEFAQWIPVNTIFQTLSGFISSGFANKEEAISLQLQEPFATIKIKTIDDSSNKSMTLKFLQKDDKSYYVYITGSPTVYILEKAIGDLILLNKSQLTD